MALRGVLYCNLGDGVLGKVINLNKYRKRRAKLEREKQAEVNRRLHGRNAAERARDELAKRQLTRAVDGAKLEGNELEGNELEGNELEGDSERAARDGADEEAPEPGGG